MQPGANLPRNKTLWGKPEMFLKDKEEPNTNGAACVRRTPGGKGGSPAQGSRMLISLQPEGWRPEEKSGEVRAARPEAGAVPGCSEDHHSSPGPPIFTCSLVCNIAPISQLLKVLKTGQADSGCLRSIRVCSASLIQALSRLQEPRRSVSCLEAGSPRSGWLWGCSC